MATALTETGAAAAMLVLAALGIFRMLSINVEKACIKLSLQFFSTQFIDERSFSSIWIHRRVIYRAKISYL